MSQLEHITVEPAVKRAIAVRGVAGESYNDVLKRILSITQEPQNVKGKNRKNQEGAQAENQERRLSRTPRKEPGNVNP